MKEIKTKYDLGQKLYFIYNDIIHIKPMNKIQINIQPPYNEIIDRNTIKKRDGIQIEYLFFVENKEYKNQYYGAWKNQDDVFETKDELIRSIK